jgi:hypothetical protein
MSLEEKGAAMSKKNLSSILSASARIVLAFVFVFGQTASAGENQNVKDRSGASGDAKARQPEAIPTQAPARKAEAAEEKSASAQSGAAQEVSQRGGPHEGIQVHGHWTIEVRNPDGSLVTRREFENSLQQGALALGGILGRQNSPGFWGINLSTSADCAGSGSQAILVCTIIEPTPNFAPVTGRSTNLVTTVSNNGLILSGSITVLLALQITAVQTVLSLCPATTPSPTCATGAGGTGNAFTFTTLATPIAVATGQTVQATVAISFS